MTQTRQARQAAAGGQQPSVLRKRSPLAEKSTNVKQAKSSPNSHPGEKRTKRSSRGKARIIDDSSDEESLCENLDDSFDEEFLCENLEDVGGDDENLGDLLGQEIYDEDVEDVEDGDTVDTAEGAEQLREWFHYSDRGDRLAGLNSQEQDNRIGRCRARLSFILAALIQTAQQIQKAEFNDPNKSKEVPFGFAWWVFFSKMILEKVLDIMMASLSNTAKVILGGLMDSKELLLLPSKWEGCKLWGVYTDIFKAARYCGSGTNKKGVASRMNMYPAVHNGTRKAEEGAHGDLLMREQPNLRLIAAFDPSATSKPYVLLMELLLSILLQTLNTGTVKTYMRASTIDMIQGATPLGLPKPSVALNNAAQCLQPLYFKRQGTVCGNENCGTTETPQWLSADPGVPFSLVICSACYIYRKTHNGDERPAKLAARPKKVYRPDLIKQAGPKPTGKSPCPGCGRTDVPKHKWQLPTGDLYRPGRTAWECSNCYYKPASKLLVNGGKLKNQGVRRPDLNKQAGPRPTGNSPCPGCGNTNVPEGNWCLPKGDFYQPGRTAWECKTCYEKPAPALPVNGGKIIIVRTHLIKQAGPKPTGKSPCPGCGKTVAAGKRWYIPKGDLCQPGRTAWECTTCYDKPASKLPVNAGK